MFLRSSLCVIAAFCISACGGGGGSTSSKSAPSPTTTATPAPTPAPVINYAKAYNFDAEFNYPLVTASLERVGTYAGGEFIIQNEGRMLDVTTNSKFLSWDLAAETIHFDYGGERFVFDRSDLEYDAGNGRIYRKQGLSPYRHEGLYIVEPNPNSKYLISANQVLEYELTDGTGRNTEIERYVVGGSYTIPSDLPTSGIVKYKVIASSTTPTRDGAGGFTATDASGTSTSTEVTLDFAYRSFRISIPFKQISSTSGQPVRMTVTLVGAFDPSTGKLEGTIESPDSNYAGSFAGAFFGPKASELGIVFILKHPTDSSVVGTIVAFQP